MNQRQMELIMDAQPKGEISSKLMKGVEVQRTRTIKAGELLFCDCYPVWSLETNKSVQQIAAARSQSEGSTEKQKRLNAWHSQRRLEMLINENFDDGDLLVTLTYLPEEMPATWQEAKKDRVNFIRRVREDAKKRHEDELWYVAVMEESHGRYGVRYHHHLTIHCPGLTRERAEEIWGRKHKGWANTKAAKKQREGLLAWAKYVSKEIGSNKGQTIPTDKRWYASTGMKKPWQKATQSDRRISRAKVREMAMVFEKEKQDGNQKTAREVLEKVYKGYELLDVNVWISDKAPGAYVYALMCRRRD